MTSDHHNVSFRVHRTGITCPVVVTATCDRTGISGIARSLSEREATESALADMRKARQEAGLEPA